MKKRMTICAMTAVCLAAANVVVPSAATAAIGSLKVNDNPILTNPTDGVCHPIKVERYQRFENATKTHVILFTRADCDSNYFHSTWYPGQKTQEMGGYYYSAAFIEIS
ncbi:hypothetical protein SUDANB95_02007 [Actinosynnema sp. ALI-1.44]